MNIEPSLQAKAYKPGLSIEEVVAAYGIQPEDVLKLGSNENPYGPSPLAVAALEQYSYAKLNIYPEVTNKSLSGTIAQRFNLSQDTQVVVGCGMDAVLETLARALLSPGERVLLHTPTFSYYRLVSSWAGAEVVCVKTSPEDQFALNIHDMLAAIERFKPRLVFLCSPNNPTGTCISRDAIQNIAALAGKFEGYVFVDEAYAEYAGQNYLDMVSEHWNVIVGRTFSKLYGLAGLRVGWAAIPSSIAEFYLSVQTPFNVASPSAAAAIAAIADDQHIVRSLASNQEQLRIMVEGLQDLGLQVIPGRANFVAVRTGSLGNGPEICAALLSRGVIVRDASTFSDAPNDLVRITLGNPAQNKRLLSVLAEVLAR